jgi:hypothetical protein
MIELLFLTPHMKGWDSVFARSIPEAFEALQRRLDTTMRDNTHIKVYEINKIQIRYYRHDPRKCTSTQ